MRSANRVQVRVESGPEASADPAHVLLREPGHAILSILESVTDGLVVADLSGRFLLFNQAAERILGVGLTEAEPAAWTTTYGLFLPDAATPFPPEDLPLARALRGETVVDEEIFVRNPRLPEGTWISVNATPWKDTDGLALGAIAVFREVTAHKAAAETVQRLSRAVEQTADSVVITDRDGKILYVNPAFEQTTGYSQTEAVGRTPRLLRSGRQDAGFYAEMWSTLLAGRVFQGTIVNRKKSGELYYAEQTISPMKDGAGNVTHFVSVGKDITELRKAAEQELEVQLARRVQLRLYPRHAPRFAGVDIAGVALPSTTMCGDYYDYLAMPEGRLGVVIGDVSGHGLGPALVMAETRACLRSCMETHADPDEILQRVNTALLEDLQSGYFVTLVLASLDVRSGTLVYASAGHPTGYVLDASGAVKHAMESTRIPLGVLSDLRGEPERRVAIEPGDTLVLLTDGFLESRGPAGDSLGIEQVLEIVRRRRTEPAQRILDHLYAGARAFFQDGPPQDDLTAVICKVTAAG